MGDQDTDMEAADIARAIIRYLNGHPDAKDTMEGIASWWLLREWTERKTAEVRRAVSLLVDKKLLVEMPRGSQPPCYKLNGEKEAEIRSFLSQ